MNDVTIDPRPRPAQQRVRREPFVFSGSTREYFGIWIVNVLLTIVTLGIYSAWAKVRRQRYFYGNTSLAGATFDYHARPRQILVGRIAVVVLFLVYNGLTTVAPLASLAVGVVFLFAVPWFIMRGLRFNARVTSYRNVRFDFVGGYWGAFLAYIVGGFLMYISLGILAPLASQWMWNYTLGNVRYGGRPVRCEPRLGRLYGRWWLPASLVSGGLVVLATTIVGTYWAYVRSGIALDEVPIWAAILLANWLTLILFGLLLLFAMAGLFYRAGIRNVAFNETVIDGRHMLHSSIRRRRFAWISVTNLLATVFSLGLARPWAAIRMARYLSLVTALDATGSLEDYAGSIEQSGSAVGAEYMDIEGFDLGF
ncbi:membrane protein [Mesorhizobium sp. L-8-10]|uniref:YjgN family protein n=1 Tax=Mesorhizobium sp. L-8-10 TaxID=2744523 RepID=UPI0019259366|nr:YjgN family protein [Mesorhizobium sp. L-8-10]BCH34350.1 membrane protein [Mesorhizobium sp. L-8-10]